MSQITPVIQEGITCGESPVWIAAEGMLYFTDIPGNKMHRYHPASKQHDTWGMPEELCCFAPRIQGGFVAGLRSGFALLDLENNSVDYVARPEINKPDNRLNDGRCDRQGRFWAGSMNEPRTDFAGVLYRLDTDFTCTPMAGDVIVSNGLAWSPDSTTLYWSDSRNRKIFAFDFNADDGSVSNRRLFFETTEDQGRPDGATVDAEGFYWSACYMGGRVLRIAPDGTLDREILLPVRDITMVCFGGDNLDVLYITTSCEALSQQERAASPLAGAVFTTIPGVQGLPEPCFAG